MRYEIKGETLPVVVCYLESGEKMITERGSMSWMTPNMLMETSSNGGMSVDIQTVSGLKNKVFGGEGFFNTIVTGPGHVWLQTMPISGVAAAISRFIPSRN